jgi:hypothetical protein
MWKICVCIGYVVIGGHLSILVDSDIDKLKLMTQLRTAAHNQPTN